MEPAHLIVRKKIKKFFIPDKEVPIDSTYYSSRGACFECCVLWAAGILRQAERRAQNGSGCPAVSGGSSGARLNVCHGK